jgi:hypothetical protein
LKDAVAKAGLEVDELDSAIIGGDQLKKSNAIETLYLIQVIQACLQ